jgi:hypothetical protein
MKAFPTVRTGLENLQSVHSVNGLIRVGPYPGCVPNYWIDRVNWGRDESMLKTLEPTDVIAVEAYVRGGEIPAQFTSRSNNCGVIVIWTRRSW